MHENRKQLVHLHVHSGYSLKDGLSKIKALVSRAKALGMTALAITEHGNMFSAVYFYKECKRQGIKPIIGCEMYICPSGKEDKVRDNRHLVLLAKNDIGYRNLVKILSDANLNGYYYNPRTDYEMLRNHSEGLIALSACLGGDVARAYNDTLEATKNITQAYKVACNRVETYIDIFGKEDFYLEVQDNGIQAQYAFNDVIYKLAEQYDLKVVATNDCHYVNKGDALHHDVLMAMQEDKLLTDTNRKKYESEEFYLKSFEEMNRGRVPEETIVNTLEVADKCNFDFEFGNYHIPVFDCPDGFDNQEQFLRHLVYEGMERRYPDFKENEQLYTERAEYELGIIREMGFNDYFLITWDFVNFSKSNDIAVGPGRGSAAGSIVSYSLGITDVDPIRFKLLFERFLNPERISMPDIDLDFSTENRHKVIEYVTRKYGSDRVCKIITYGTYGARGSIRAVGKTLNVPGTIIDKIAKAVPDTPGISLNDAFDQSEELTNLYNTNKDAKEIIDIAFSIEGNPSHTSSHAAGILITPTPIWDYVPVIRDKEGNVVAAFDMTTLEELGLLKVDFLGLRNLDVIDYAVKNIKRSKGIDITRQDLLNYVDDPNAYKLMARGLTLGLFQVESEGMAKWAKEMRVGDIFDASALLALYRPGPMDYIPAYIDNKSHPDNIQVPFEELRELLSETYGIIVYQEQVMIMSRILAGFTPGMSDYLRKGLGKKKEEVILECKNYLLYGKKDDEDNVIAPGAITLGHDEHKLVDFYDGTIVPFARYSFNKSHSVGYAFITAQTGALKYYFPAEYLAALLTTVSGIQDRVMKYTGAANEMGIEVLPPSINHSMQDYSVDEDGNIRMSLSTIKGVGDNVVDVIVEEREKNGKFENFSDFVFRCCDIGLDSKSLEGLIRAGAFAEMGLKKSALLSCCHKTLDTIKKRKVKATGSFMSPLFPSMLFNYDVVPNIKEFPHKILLKTEKDALGLYMTGHPLDSFKSIISRKTNIASTDFVREVDDTGLITKDYNIVHDQEAKIVGVITDIRVIRTKKGQGDLMAFLTLEDTHGTVSVTLFPSIYEKYADELQIDDIVYVYGVVNHTGDYEPSIAARRIDKLQQEYIRKVIIETPGSDIDLYKLREKMVAICRQCHGDIPVIITKGNIRVLLNRQFWVNEQGMEAILNGIPDSKTILE